ncbi:hypothetical protein BHM03_00063059 [Ensete ventricosum]|nr:hypothetical protein BHM03_00063059 [Ensete ventricosum]
MENKKETEKNRGDVCGGVLLGLAPESFDGVIAADESECFGKQRVNATRKRPDLIGATWEVI